MKENHDLLVWVLILVFLSNFYQTSGQVTEPLGTSRLYFSNVFRTLQYLHYLIRLKC